MAKTHKNGRAMREPTEKTVKDFIKRRNKSEFQSNFQFQSDLDAAGIDMRDGAKVFGIDFAETEELIRRHEAR